MRKRERERVRERKREREGYEAKFMAKSLSWPREMCVCEFQRKRERE